jgi:hypothetical protein
LDHASVPAIFFVLCFLERPAHDTSQMFENLTLLEKHLPSLNITVYLSVGAVRFQTTLLECKVSIALSVVART